MTQSGRPKQAEAKAPKARRFRCDPALRHLLQELNARYFDNSLPLHEYAIAWSRKSDDELGQVDPYSFTHEKPLISISAELRHNTERLTHTALHELVHVLLTPNKLKDDHGWRFRAEMRRLEKAGACRVPVLRYDYLDEETGKTQKHTCKMW